MTPESALESAWPGLMESLLFAWGKMPILETTLHQFPTVTGKESKDTASPNQDPSSATVNWTGERRETQRRESCRPEPVAQESKRERLISRRRWRREQPWLAHAGPTGRSAERARGVCCYSRWIRNGRELRCRCFIAGAGGGGVASFVSTTVDGIHSPPLRCSSGNSEHDRGRRGGVCYADASLGRPFPPVPICLLPYHGQKQTSKASLVTALNKAELCFYLTIDKT